MERMFWIISQIGPRTYRDFSHSEQIGLSGRVRFLIGLSGSDGVEKAEILWIFA